MADTKTTTTLHDSPVPLRAKLAAAWTSFMFLYIYVDYLHLYKPGAVADILAGVVWELDISQSFVVFALTSVAIPILMILLSMTLPARANRRANLVVATLYFIEYFSYQQIADVVGCPVVTVRSLLHRGRRMLQKSLWRVAQERGIVPTAEEDD